MRLEFLGDSYEVVKRSLLDALSALGSWSMHPMLTEFGDSGRVAELERMIGVPAVSSEVLTVSTNRRTFLARAASAGHLFIDPNTGLRLGHVRKGRAPDFLFMDELVGIAVARPHALTMVFDQSLSRASRQADLEKKLCRLREAGIAAFAYDSHACFVIAGRDGLLIERARNRVRDALGLPEWRLLSAD